MQLQLLYDYLLSYCVLYMSVIHTLTYSKSLVPYDH